MAASSPNPKLRLLLVSDRRPPSFPYVLKEVAVCPDEPERQTAMFKDSHLRLLMKLSGLRLLDCASEETPESTWIIPGDVTADKLKDTLHFISQAEFSPPTFEEGVLAEHQLKLRTVPRRKAHFDDDDGEDALDDAYLFPPGGPTTRKFIDEAQEPSKTGRRRRRGRSTSEPPDEAELDERARKRREREKEKARKIKSAVYIKDGDDEFDSDEDREFFARERAIAARAQKIAEDVAATGDGVTELVAAASRKRKSNVALLDDSDDDEDQFSIAWRPISSESRDGRDDENDDTEDTPLDSSEGETRKRRCLSAEDEEVHRRDGGSEANGTPAVTGEGSPETAETKAAPPDASEQNKVPTLVRKRPRVRGGFVIDSDDDE